MCGFVFARLQRPPSTPQLEAAYRFLRRRGPDQSGQLLEQDASGHTLLFSHHLLDISGRAVRQPLNWPPLPGSGQAGGGDSSADELRSADGSADPGPARPEGSRPRPRYTLLFNGEIYNYASLDPQATADSLMLLPLFERLGAGLWPLLDGEFAITVYDHWRQQLHLAADPFLTKPFCIGVGASPSEIGVASYPSCLQALGFRDIRFLEPNQSRLIQLHAGGWEVVQQSTIQPFDLKQTVNHFDAWEESFLEAVRKRVEHGQQPVVVPLSGGYDSGAICLALNLLGLEYHTISMPANENEDMLRERIARNRKAGCRSAVLLSPLQTPWRLAIRAKLETNCEPYVYEHEPISLFEDEGTYGAYCVAEEAALRGWLVALSGCGADEIVSDYGHQGVKFYPHSEFGGLFPDALEGFFPWKKFYGDSMRSYLFKDELVLGANGLEGRYPFLDHRVVQSFLNLTPALKNSAYKAPIAAFLRRHDYPFEAGVKRGFQPMGVGPSWRGRLKRLVAPWRQPKPGASRRDG
ncbi:MAG: asparagine synthase-related protein [Synechococcaceae cyanobacterium]|nr:asparagine synthase-related protein [Synechococcaceae cyanobacterium]